MNEFFLVAWAFGLGFNACGLFACFAVPGTGRTPKWIFGASAGFSLVALVLTAGSTP